MVLDRLQGVLHGEATAVGVPDDEKRPPLTHVLVNVPRPEPGRRQPVLPGDRDEARGRGAMAGQTQGEDVVTFVDERLGHLSQAEG